MKKMTIALSAVAGLAAATVAMASPVAAVSSVPVSAGDTVQTLEANRFEVISGQVDAAPVRRCVVIDPAAVGTNHDPTKQVLPTSCP